MKSANITTRHPAPCIHPRNPPAHSLPSMPFPHPRIADDKATDEILWHTGLKIAQASSLVLPPLYVVTAIIRRARGIQSGFSINRMLRATWIGGTALSVAAPPIAWQIKLKNEPTAAMVDRWERLVGPRENACDFQVLTLSLHRGVPVSQRKYLP